jgi:hypothetical protein
MSNQRLICLFFIFMRKPWGDGDSRERQSHSSSVVNGRVLSAVFEGVTAHEVAADSQSSLRIARNGV